MNDIEKLKRRIARTQAKVDAIKKAHGENPYKTHTYYGGWSLGYWVGRLSLLEDILDEMEEEQGVLKNEA